MNIPVKGGFDQYCGTKVRGRFVWASLTGKLAMSLTYYFAQRCESPAKGEREAIATICIFLREQTGGF